jgi:hypothetical protein
MKNSPVYDEVKPLIELVRQGRLFDVQEWIAQGKSVNAPATEPKKQRRHGPLEEAMNSGFHSMVLILVEAGANLIEIGPNCWTRFCALTDAVTMKRLDLIDLLIFRGANINSVCMLTVYETWDPVIMRYFIDRGVHPAIENSLATALCWRIRTALGVCKQYKKQFPDIQEQMDVALRHHATKGNKKWVSLMLWAGADPYSVGPDEVEIEQDTECYECALKIAVWKNLDWVFDMKQVKLHPDKASSKDIFDAVCYAKCITIFEKLLDAGFADIQTQAEQTELISTIMRHMSYESYYVHQDYYNPYPERRMRKPLLDTEYCRDGVHKLKMLFDRGWVWKPSMDEIKSFRRHVLKIDGKYFIEILEMARSYKLASYEMLNELTRTPTARARLAANKFNSNRYLETINW